MTKNRVYITFKKAPNRVYLTFYNDQGRAYLNYYDDQNRGIPHFFYNHQTRVYFTFSNDQNSWYLTFYNSPHDTPKVWTYWCQFYRHWWYFLLHTPGCFCLGSCTYNEQMDHTCHSQSFHNSSVSLTERLTKTITS